MSDWEAVPANVARLLARPVRWAPSASMLSTYDGHERTLQVFDTPVADQLLLLERLEVHQQTYEEMAGGPLVVMFYSPAQSLRLRLRESRSARSVPDASW